MSAPQPQPRGWSISDRNECVLVAPNGDRVFCETSSTAAMLVVAINHHSDLMRAVELLREENESHLDVCSAKPEDECAIRDAVNFATQIQESIRRSWPGNSESRVAS